MLTSVLRLLALSPFLKGFLLDGINNQTNTCVLNVDGTFLLLVQRDEGILELG